MLSIFSRDDRAGAFLNFFDEGGIRWNRRRDGNDEGADPADGDPGIRCNGHAASRLNAICSTHGISEDLLYDHFSGKTIFTWPDSHCFLDVTEYLKEKDIGMPGSCCLRRSGHCGRRLTPLIEGYIGAVLALFVSKLVSKLKLPSILGPHALSLVSQELLDAAWYQSVVHVLECVVGLMIGTELVWNKSKKSGRSIIITTLTQSLGMDSHIRRIAQSGQDDAEQAVDHIQKTDKKREQYYRFYFGQQFGDAKNYDLCLNSGVIGGPMSRKSTN